MLLLLFSFSIYAKENKRLPLFSKPNDFSYISLGAGFIHSPIYVKQGTDYYSTSAVVISSFNRFSGVDYVMAESAPRRKFHVRDLMDVNFGVGKGKEFYLNLNIGFGLKFKYDLSKKIDFGLDIGANMLIDHMAYLGYQIVPFARFGRLRAEVAYGNNESDKIKTSQQRKYLRTNLKFYKDVNNPQSTYYFLNYFRYHARNGSIYNEWESSTQFSIGMGFNLSK